MRFEQQPVLIHPLSGAAFDLGKTGRLDIDPAHIKLASSAHFKSLIEADAQGEPDAKKTALAFWRFGPEIDADGLRMLWQLLPADTRIPDHTIWTHLDLTSAFASAFEGDPDANPALLTMSFGPVQDFIAQGAPPPTCGPARTAPHGWHGNNAGHLRATRPDAVLFFPSSAAYPRSTCGCATKWGIQPEALHGHASGPYKDRCESAFAAALPNCSWSWSCRRGGNWPRRSLQRSARFRARHGFGNVSPIFEAAGIHDSPELACREQLRAQLDGFPEVHWAALKHRWIEERTGRSAGYREPAAVSAPFSAPERVPPAAFARNMETPSRPLDLEGTRFYRPNPGVLYPAIYEPRSRCSQCQVGMAQLAARGRGRRRLLLRPYR